MSFAQRPWASRETGWRTTIRTTIRRAATLARRQILIVRVYGSRAFIKNEGEGEGGQSICRLDFVFNISFRHARLGVWRASLPGPGFNINAGEIEILISIQSRKVLSAAGFHRVTVS